MTLKADRLNFLLNKGSDATKTDDVRGITNDVFYTYNNRKATDNTAQYENERVIGEVDPLTFSNSETAPEAPDGTEAGAKEYDFDLWKDDDYDGQ